MYDFDGAIIMCLLCSVLLDGVSLEVRSILLDYLCLADYTVEGGHKFFSMTISKKIQLSLSTTATLGTEESGRFKRWPL